MFQKLMSHFSAFSSSVSFCLSLSWQTSKKYTCLRLICNLATPLLAVLLSFLGKCVIDLLSGDIRPACPVFSLALLAALSFFVSVIRVLIRKILQYIQSMHNEIIGNKLSLYMIDWAGQADLEHFDNPDYYDRLTSCMCDTPVIANLVWNVLSALSSLVSFLFIFFLLGNTNFLYSILMVCVAVPASLADLHYTKLMYRLKLDQTNGERQKSYMQNLAVDRRFSQSLRLYDAFSYIKEKYQRIFNELFAERRLIMRKQRTWTSILECLPEIALAGISFDLSRRVLEGHRTLGDYSLYIGLLSQLWSSIFILSGALMQIFDNQLKISNLKSLSRYRSRIDNTGALNLTKISSIEFEHVTFTYPGTATAVLNDVSFSIKEGEIVALVGLNGSGKSTLIKLLLRLYDVDQGSIRINGINIREYQINSLRENFSVYFQNDPCYSLTLRENISIANIRHPVDDSSILDSFEKSGAQDVLNLAANGLDTPLTRLFDRDGLELSGGQFQKLALARTFYRHHTALILDEPSSNLDPQAEQDFFDRLLVFARGKTVLFTSHHLTNALLADRVVVLENGQVLEDGTNNDLLQGSGRYAELVRCQQRRYYSQNEEHTDAGCTN